MMRIFAFLWLMLFAVAGGYLAVRVSHGLHFRTDLMALLPQEEQNPDVRRANDLVTDALSQHVVFLIGHKNRDSAREAATELAHQFTDAGLLDITTDKFDKDQLKQLGALYFPHRSGLLSDKDRDLLKAGQGQQIAGRALSQVFGVTGMANAKLLHDDPFLLMPAFLTSLPVPLSRLSLDDGMLSMEDQGTHWVLVAGQLRGAPFDLDIQKKISGLYEHIVQTEPAAYPGLEILHLGAVFFAKAGAEEAMGETSTIGIVSTLGVMVLMLVVFRGARPLLLSLLVIGVGIVTALSVSLMIFGELHVGALLFGISLIGVAVDYSLQYCSEAFAAEPGTPQQRLQRVFAGISIGTATTIIGYLTLYLAPFPGLHQIAAFSVIGLLAAWATAVLWLPLLDQRIVPPQRRILLVAAQRLLSFWEEPQYGKIRAGLLGALAVLTIVGFWHFYTDDNVRHMQSLSGMLVAEQEKIQKLIGSTAGAQSFIVQAAADEAALQKEEALVDRLRPLMAAGELAGFQSPAQYIPSQARQVENRTLQTERLYQPLLTAQIAQLNLTDAPQMPEAQVPFLTLSDARKLEHPPAFLSNLLFGDGDNKVTHIVSLDAVAHPEIVAKAAQGIEGIRFIDPAGDFSLLLGKYRSRCLGLLALSAALMAPLLIWRYGFSKGAWVLVPPMLAVVMTPALRALAGDAFTFFDAMALVLILSVGVDYAVFCAETSQERKAVTMLAVTMAACTALMSFGLLALSHVSAVHHFGATMTVGILLSFFFAPMARLSSKENRAFSLRGIFAIGLVCLLIGCASSAPPSVQELPAFQTVSIAPKISIILPSPADLGRTVEATQLVTAHYGDQTFAFEAHISATPEHFKLTGLDLMGRKIITIDWTKDKIAFETAPWVPRQLRPENILADLVLLYWPRAVAQKSLAGSSGVLVVGAHSRIIMQGATKIWQADYEPTKIKDLWAGVLHYQNLSFGYTFDVQSIESVP